MSGSAIFQTQAFTVDFAEVCSVKQKNGRTFHTYERLLAKHHPIKIYFEKKTSRHEHKKARSKGNGDYVSRSQVGPVKRLHK